MGRATARWRQVIRQAHAAVVRCQQCLRNSIPTHRPLANNDPAVGLRLACRADHRRALTLVLRTPACATGESTRAENRQAKHLFGLRLYAVGNDDRLAGLIFGTWDRTFRAGQDGNLYLVDAGEIRPISCWEWWLLVDNRKCPATANLVVKGAGTYWLGRWLKQLRDVRIIVANNRVGHAPGIGWLDEGQIERRVTGHAHGCGVAGGQIELGSRRSATKAFESARCRFAASTSAAAYSQSRSYGPGR